MISSAHSQAFVAHSEHHFSFLQDLRWRAFQLWPKINHGLQRNFRLYQLPTGSDGISQVHIFSQMYFFVFIFMETAAFHCRDFDHPHPVMDQKHDTPAAE